MTTTLTAILADVRDRVDEATAKQWSDATLTRWINQGLLDVARHSETIMDRANVTAVAGTQEYAMPTNTIRVYRVEYLPTGSSQVYPLEYRDWNNMDAVWWTSQTISQATPSLFTLWGFPPQLKLIVYPKPAAAGVFKVFYYRTPATLASGSDIPEIPEGWTDLVAGYCEYMALRRDADPRWQEAYQIYKDNLQSMIDMTRRWSDQAGSIEVNTNFVPGWLWGSGGGGGDY